MEEFGDQSLYSRSSRRSYSRIEIHTGMSSIADPRVFPLSSSMPLESAREWLALAEQSVAATGVNQRAHADDTLEQAFSAAFANGDIDSVRAALDASRSASEYRQLWRAAIAAWRRRTSRTSSSSETSGGGAVAHGFAIPVVVVAASDDDLDLPMTLSQPQAIVEVMQQHGALGGNQNFGLGSVLGGERSVGLDGAARWPSPAAIVDSAALVDAIAASPIHVVGGRESAHLRWLVGSAIAGSSTDLFVERQSGKWGLKAAEAMSPQLSRGNAQVLALPGAPGDLLSAWQSGVVAHREVALQLYASSALRKLRAAYGEPGAVISAHRTDPGELRIGLSSPFATPGPDQSEGFRCPLFPFERIDDVLKTITDLLEACRIAAVTVLGGIHPDRDARTGLPLFFRSDSLPSVATQNNVQL